MVANAVTPIVTPYEYVGDVPALGGIQLTKLAESYEQLESQGLEDLFPVVTINERTVVIETIKEGLGIMPIVQAGIPAGNFMEPERIERRYYQPAYVREDDFIDQLLINQLREAGTMNEQSPPLQIVQRRVQRMVNRHNRTRMVLQSQVLQGGINYTDPRTGVSLNVSTQIPTHNYFRYDGWDASVASGGAVATGYTAYKTLTNNKGRKEALLFTSKDGKAGVPWTDGKADILKSLRILKQYLYNTNKNMYTDIVMSRDLYTAIIENELLQAYMGGIGVVVSGQATSTFREYPMVTFSAGGDLDSMAGLKIRLIDSLYRDPVDNVVKKLWPNNMVALVARKHFSGGGATLGYTQECVGESPDGKAGLWMRTGPDQMPPSVPGRAMQMGNAFLPFATYPQWIALLTVAETDAVDSYSILRSDLSYGTF
jgi:hypothetical protein